MLETGFPFLTSIRHLEAGLTQSCTGIRSCLKLFAQAHSSSFLLFLICFRWATKVPPFKLCFAWQPRCTHAIRHPSIGVLDWWVGGLNCWFCGGGDATEPLQTTAIEAS